MKNTTGNKRLDAMVKLLIDKRLGGGNMYWTAIWADAFGKMFVTR